ncbi:TonB family protein [Tellurirhabdus rosea]|uniref:TonB family protein n=1 Tax=Tellurirhabdus rosea TaxID=2674997 RepID=UPI002B1CBE65
MTVSGRVTDSDGKPLAGANVVVVGTTRGTTTDAQGKFLLVKVPSDGKLAVSFVGFSTEAVAVLPTLTIRLNRQPVALDRVVVVSYLPKEAPLQQEKSPSPKPDTEEVFKVVEQQPEFPGGHRALMEYIARNVRYPTRARQANVTGIVMVEFVVSEAGRVQDVKVMKGIGFGCDAEATRVVSEMNQLSPWQPGKQNGKPVAVSYVLPVSFELEGATDKRSGYNETPKLPNNLPLGDFPDYYGKATPKNSRGSVANVSMPRGFFSIPSDTIDLKEPLFILDGVVQKNKRAVRQLDPRLIKSINVLKGETAQQLYGLAGKNGVLLINTKETDPDSLRSTSK